MPLPKKSSAFKMYDTLTRKLCSFKPVIKPKKGEKSLVRLYTCGPTVYNIAHIGNLRAYLFEDLLRRYLKFKGFRVKQVMNLTDVDDKTIRGSQKEGIPLMEFTKKYKEAFFEDLKRINIDPAEIYPSATDHISEMITLISALLEKGIAYQTPDHCVWFSIAKAKRYGQLSKIKVSKLKAGASGRVLADEYEKEQAGDFALWKAWDKDDGDVFWNSPFGKGRPGWHIECSAMSMKHLTDAFQNNQLDPDGFETIDIHTGGVDNIFPHHEDEIAQTEGAVKKQFVKFWMHCEHLLVDGKKMSKSLGNFYTLRDIIGKGHDPRSFRFLINSVHYRQKLNFTFGALAGAKEAVKALDDFILNLGGCQASSNCQDLPQLLKNLEQEFSKEMDNDLSASPAMASIFLFMRNVNKLHDLLSAKDAEKIRALLKRIDEVLAIMKFTQDEAPQDIRDLAYNREDARKRKDWKKADEIRGSILAKGWVVEDLPGGPRLKKAQ